MADRDGRGLKLGQHNVQVLEVLRRRKAAAAEEGATMMDEPITAAEGANALSSTEMSSRLEAKPKVRHRRKMLSVDPDLLKTVAASFNIQVRGRGGAGGLSYEAALGQILEQLAQGQSYAVTRTTSQFLPDDGAIAAIRDQARTLAWLTERMEALEQLVETLKLERDEAIAQVRQVQVSAQGEALRLENQRLKQECDEARRKLQAFRQLLLGTESLTDAFQDEKEQELEQGQEQELEQRELEQEQAVDDRMMRPVESAIAPALTRSSVDVSDSPKSPKKRIPEKEALHHIRRAVQALISLNSQEGRAFNDKWYISFPVVQTLLRTHGLSANQKHVAAVFDELKTELEKHHEQHEIGSRHNRRHPNLEKIAEIIELNELMG